MIWNKQVFSRLYEQICMDWLETKTTTTTTKNKIDVAVQTEKGSGKILPMGILECPLKGGGCIIVCYNSIYQL